MSTAPAIHLTETSDGFKTMPGTDYRTFFALLTKLEERGVQVRVMDDEGTMYVSFV